MNSVVFIFSTCRFSGRNEIANNYLFGFEIDKKFELLIFS
jgi:hypothetical protein